MSRELVNHLDELSHEYEASTATLDALREKTMIPLLGPFAVGKTTLMDEVVQMHHSQFHRVRSFTTRKPRSGESLETYTFLEHSETTLRKIQEEAEKRELVQFMVHPNTGKVYGSTLDDYGTTPNVMLDIVPKALPPIEALPFKRIEKIEVVAVPQLWKDRMQQRFIDNDPTDIANRLTEADDNLTWALEQGDDITWLDNTTSIHEGASSLKEIVDGEYSRSLDARFVGEALLREIQDLRRM